MGELTTITISKTNTAKQIVYGEVYIPNRLDTDVEYMTADSIEEAAHSFLRKSMMGNIDQEHDLQKTGAVVVESFIARKGDLDFIEGSWVLGVWVPDDLWEQVQTGEINGFSMYGNTNKVERTVEVELPDDGKIIGKTEDNAGHTHQYQIQFDQDGNFLGGVTDTVDGHAHTISKGTATEKAGEDSHSHRYSFLEIINDLQS